MYKTAVLPVILHGSETCFLNSRGVHESQVSENKVIRETFGLKTDELSEQFRIIYEEELRDLYR
jgi:hypothetical protein